MFSEKLKEWIQLKIIRFRGRKFYQRVRNIYTRSNEIDISNETRKKYYQKLGGK